MSPRGHVGGMHRDSGAAAVELAIILPLLILIVAGIVDFGRAMYTQSILTNAAREGARAAVVGADYSTRAISAANGVAGATASSTPAGGCPPGSPGQVTITMSAPFEWIILGPAMDFFGGSASLPSPLSSAATMQCGG